MLMARVNGPPYQPVARRAKADCETGHGGGDDHRERDPRASEDAGPLVASDGIGAKPMLGIRKGRWKRESCSAVGKDRDERGLVGARIVRCDKATEDAHRQQRQRAGQADEQCGIRDQST